MLQDVVELIIHCFQASDFCWRFFDLVAEFAEERAALVHVVILCFPFCYVMTLLTMMNEVLLAIEVFVAPMAVLAH